MQFEPHFSFIFDYENLIYSISIGDIAQADAKSKIAAFELILNGFPAVDSFFLLRFVS